MALAACVQCFHLSLSLNNVSCRDVPLESGRIAGNGYSKGPIKQQNQNHTFLGGLMVFLVAICDWSGMRSLIMESHIIQIFFRMSGCSFVSMFVGLFEGDKAIC